MEMPNNSNNVTISEDIKYLVLESQKLLLEFFKNNAQNFDPSKFERMKEVFSTFSVIYISPAEDTENSRLGGGRCNGETKTISINKEMVVYPGEKENGITKEYKIMACIIHEYGHAFSNDFRLTSKTIEEGMQIFLEEKIMEYYFKTRGIPARHRNIGGKTSYKSLAKTLLYVLSKDNQDINALSEYLFGDKQKFFGMLFSEDFIKNKNLNVNNVDLLSKKELYNQFPDRFVDIDESSIYCDDNDIIHCLWLQNYVEEDILGDDSFRWLTNKQSVLEKYKEKYGKEAVVDAGSKPVKTY